MSKMKKIEVPPASCGTSEVAFAKEDEEEVEDVFHESFDVDSWAGAQRMFDSPCPIPGCDGKGDTLFLLNKVPFFRELIIASFCCKQCGGRNNEVSFGGEIQPKGCRITLKVTEASDMNRQLIKSDSASCRFEELDFEIPAGTQKGEITTLEGLITQAADNLNMFQAERMVQMPEVGAKVALIIMELRMMANGDKVPFTLTLSDVAGNSFIENPIAPTPDPNMTKVDFRRSAEEDISLGLNPETAGHSDDIKMSADDNGIERLLESSQQEQKGEEKENIAEILETEDDRVLLGKEEVAGLPSPCPNCNKMGEMRSAFTSIPHFKEVLIMAFNCAYCGLRQSEVKAGGAIPTFGTETTLYVKSPEDLKRDVLKGESASIGIPELDLLLMGGTLGGVYTSIEGMLEKVYTNLRDNNPFGVGDSTTLHHSEEESTNKSAFKDFLKSLKDLSEGNSYPFTIVIRDALGNSFISGPLGSHLPPESDPNLKITDYERTEEENEDYGLLDMNTADFETGYEDEDKEAIVLPDRVTHRLKKNEDHPTPFAQGCPDDTPMGIYNPKEVNRNKSGGGGGGGGGTAAQEVEEEEDEEEAEYLQPPEGYGAAKHSLGGMDDTTYSHTVEAQEQGDSDGAGTGASGGHWQDEIDLQEYTMRKLGDDTALKDEFIPYEEFSGAKEGKVYRLGSLGLGYYPDVRKKTA